MSQCKLYQNVAVVTALAQTLENVSVVSVAQAIKDPVTIFIDNLLALVHSQDKYLLFLEVRVHTLRLQ